MKSYFNQLIIHRSIRIKLAFDKKKNLHLFHIYSSIYIYTSIASDISDPKPLRIVKCTVTVYCSSSKVTL